RSQRLFAQNGKPCFQCWNQHWLVELAWYSDQYGIDGIGSDGIFDFGEGLCTRCVLRRFGSTSSIRLHDCRNECARGPVVDTFDMVSTHGTGTNDADAKTFSHENSLTFKP